MHRQLADLGMPEGLIDSITTVVPRNALGLLVYGSWARGDAGEDSDVDLLVLSQHVTRGLSDAPLSMTVYTLEQLLTARRTLFGMHLARDGVVLHDSENVLRSTLDSLGAPEPVDLLARIRRYAVILDVSEAECAHHLSGLTKVARYLLRSAVYTKAMQAGEPCFSVAELADRFDEPALVSILSSHEGVYPLPSAAVFNDLVRRLETVVGPLQTTRPGTCKPWLWASGR